MSNSRLAFDIEVLLRKNITGGGEVVEHIARDLAAHVLELVADDVTEVGGGALMHDLAEANKALRAEVAKLKRDRQAFKEASFPVRMTARGMGPVDVATKLKSLDGIERVELADTFVEYRNPDDLKNPIRVPLAGAVSKVEPELIAPADHMVDLMTGSPMVVRLMSGARQTIRVFATFAGKPAAVNPGDLVCILLPANCWIDPTWPNGDAHQARSIPPQAATSIPTPRPDIDAVITTEDAWQRGHRAALLSMLYKAMGDLGYDLGREDPTILAARLAAERTEAIRVLREACEEWGDNDWSDQLHLGDVIEKHLVRVLEENADDDNLESMADAARREDD